jgi:hypothetical protein
MIAGKAFHAKANRRDLIAATQAKDRLNLRSCTGDGDMPVIELDVAKPQGLDPLQALLEVEVPKRITLNPDSKPSERVGARLVGKSRSWLDAKAEYAGSPRLKKVPAAEGN